MSPWRQLPQPFHVPSFHGGPGESGAAGAAGAAGATGAGASGGLICLGFRRLDVLLCVGAGLGFGLGRDNGIGVGGSRDRQRIEGRGQNLGRLPGGGLPLAPFRRLFGESLRSRLRADESGGIDRQYGRRTQGDEAVCDLFVRAAGLRHFPDCSGFPESVYGTFS
jgi:hypothetical protein